MNRRKFLVSLAAAGITGCLQGQNGGESQDGKRDNGGGRTIRIGVLQPLSGDLSSLGVPIKDGAILPREQINKQGTRFEIDIQVEDTETSPQKAIEGGKALVNAGYPAITGAASSESTIQVANNVLIPNGIVGCSPASTSPRITDLEDNGYIFRTAPSDILQREVIADVARNRKEAETSSVVYVNNSYGQSFSSSFTEFFEQRGGNVLKQVAIEKAQPSYTAKLQNALADNPDILIIVAYPQSGIQLLRDFYQNFGGTPILVTDGLRDPTLPQEVGRNLDNIEGTAPYGDGPAKKFFNNLYQETYGREPSVYTWHSYDCTAVLALANAAAGENTGEEIRNNIINIANPEGETVTAENLAEGLEMASQGEEIQYQGVSSSVDFDENGDIRQGSYEIFGFEDNNIRHIDTVEID